jgi:AcrR family transcriptional regulator
MATKSGELAGKELLLEVACDLFMTAGYDGVSMQQIAEAAHMTKGSPYYHFAGKEDLFAQAFVHRTNHVHDGLKQVLEQDTDFKSRLTDALTYLLSTADAGMIRLVEDFKRCVGADLAVKCQAQRLEPEAMVQLYTPIFAKAAADGTHFRLTPERTALLFFSLQMGVLHTLHMTNSLPDSQEHIHHLAADTVESFLFGAMLRTTEIGPA